jgi:hypothetical protein
MAKRRTIGTNPLDTVIPARLPESTPPKKVIKERLTVHLPVELIERIKNAVYWTPGLTLAGLAEEAFTAASSDWSASAAGPSLLEELS